MASAKPTITLVLREFLDDQARRLSKRALEHHRVEAGKIWVEPFSAVHTRLGPIAILREAADRL